MSCPKFANLEDHKRHVDEAAHFTKIIRWVTDPTGKNEDVIKTGFECDYCDFKTFGPATQIPKSETTKADKQNREDKHG